MNSLPFVTYHHTEDARLCIVIFPLEETTNKQTKTDLYFWKMQGKAESGNKGRDKSDKELQWLEKELLKVEREKQRLEREKEKFLERQAR